MNNLILFLICISFLSCLRPENIQLNSPVGGDFTIPTTNGFFNTETHRGKVLFIFFGFTHCPQICPKTLSQLNLMTKMLSDLDKEKVEILFITVDVKRDNLDVLKKRLAPYAKNFIGAVDSEERLRNLMAKFGASYTVYTGNDPDDIAIDHTSEIFIINEKGIWVNSLKYDSTSEELLAAYKSANRMPPIYANERQNRVIEVIGENRECDLSKSTCTLEGYQVSLSPLPITANKNFTIKVVAPENKSNPIEIDFEGVEQNMGHIRPQLMRTESQTFSGNFYIPSCELPQMQWRAHLILQTPHGPKAMKFYFKSTGQP